jgi:hypothetical protein
MVTEQSATCDRGNYEQAVRDYLAYCKLAAVELKAAGSSLNPEHHPTARGAVKMISHGSDPAEADKIRQAFLKAVQAAPVPHLEVSGAQAEAEPEI